MNTLTATSWAPINIALVKHWGYLDSTRTFPARSSLSLTLKHGAKTTVTWTDQCDNDVLIVNGQHISRYDGEKAKASYDLLSLIREKAALNGKSAIVTSNTDVPISGGFASSAAGAAALTIAGLHSSGLIAQSCSDSLIEWCDVARSISGIRSLQGGVVLLDTNDGNMQLKQIHTPLDLTVLSCLVEKGPKKVSSSQGHIVAPMSPFWDQFRFQSNSLIGQMSLALELGDFKALVPLIEQDALCMHSIMMTSQPSVVYATDATWSLWQSVATLRDQGLLAACTLDAGPNPHVICLSKDADELEGHLSALPEVHSVLRSDTSQRGAHLIRDRQEKVSEIECFGD